MQQDGIYHGGRVAFGYRLDGDKLVMDESQQHCLRMIHKKRGAGYSLRKLSSYVNEEWGRKLSHNAIRNILNGGRKFGMSVENC